MYNFQKFTQISQRSEMRITITSSYSFGFPTKFFKENHIEDYKYVVIYFDKEKKAIAFQFTNSEEEAHKFTIVKSGKGYGGGITATSFFKVNNIDPKQYKGRYEWEKVSDLTYGDMYVIDLNKSRTTNPATEASQ